MKKERERNREKNRAAKPQEQHPPALSNSVEQKSHDTTIGFSEVLKSGILAELDETQQDYYRRIFNSGQHLL